LFSGQREKADPLNKPIHLCINCSLAIAQAIDLVSLLVEALGIVDRELKEITGL